MAVWIELYFKVRLRLVVWVCWVVAGVLMFGAAFVVLLFDYFQVCYRLFAIDVW